MPQKTITTINLFHARLELDMVLIADSKPLKSKETKKITKQVIKCKADGKVAKDYSYRSTWKHDFSRAYNKAKRGGLTKRKC
mgnify:CR=1 FL=1